MSLSAGARLGPYEIVSMLGAGGMGEVYRAQDTRLARTVALKVIDPEVAGDPTRHARFEREARAVSSLNHPHICTLHDVGQQDGVDFLVMEYVEGETLAHRLADGPLGLEPTLKLGAQMAEALHAAHRQGIVHRDFKPGNVMLTKSGVKLLDFGLARLRRDEEAESEPGQSTFTGAPTRERPLTDEGIVMGTVPYMAPEQLEGRPADPRTDIFALGAVLHEMATGQRAFKGESRASLIAAILKDDPPTVSSVQPLSPPAFDRLLKTCLAKDPDERWQSAHDVAQQLQWMGESDRSGAGATTDARRRLWLPWTLAALSVAAAAAMASVVVSRSRSSDPPAWRSEPVRFTMPLAEREAYGMTQAVSPDGRRVAFSSRASGRSTLWVRALGALEPRALPGTEGATLPFWSPDGRWIGFFAPGKLKKVEVEAGVVQTVADAPDGRGGTWSREGVIVFAPSYDGPLQRVPATGGVPTEITALDASRTENSHRWPHFLPDGHRFLFLARSSDSARTAIRLGSLDGGSAPMVLETAPTSIAYAPPGYLLFVRNDVLVASRFDAAAGRLAGEPVAVAQQVYPFGEEGPAGYAPFSVSADGVLAYLAGAQRFGSRLVWLDRRGRELATVGPPRDWSEPALSPDGTRLALFRTDHGSLDIALVELARGVISRFTFEPTDEVSPVWSRDGRYVVYSSKDSGGRVGIYRRAADGSGAAELVFETARSIYANDFSPDGRLLVYEQYDSKTGMDLWVRSMSGESSPFLRTEFNETHSQISPNGQWLAYASDESGQGEVYVRSFPEAGGKWQVSSDGGDQPLWRADGRELFYRSADNRIVAVPIGAGSRFEPGTPQPLFPVFGGTSGVIGARTGYVVAPDGQRFLVVSPVSGPGSAAPLTMVLNWTAGLPK